MDVTDDDERIANLATGLLADAGRTDLSVSPEQVVRWRKVADAVPVAGSRRGGRGQRVSYLPTAPAAVAALALALDVDRNLDRAVLAAFGTGAPIPEPAVRSAIHHVLMNAENLFRRAYGRRNAPRSDVPRSLRVPLKHSREGAASLVSDAILAPLLGEEPVLKQSAPAWALDELATEAAEVMAPDVRRRVEFIIGRFSLAALRQVGRHVDVDHWGESCTWVVSCLDWGNAIADFHLLTGSELKATEHLQPLLPLSRMMRQADERTGYAPGYVPAILGLMAAALTWRQRRARAARETVRALAQWTPHFRALARLAADLPERWRPALAVGGAVYLASLPATERDEMAEVIGQWRMSHPAHDRALLTASAPKHPALDSPGTNA